MITASTIYLPIWTRFETIPGPSTRHSKACVEEATVKRDINSSFHRTRGRGKAWRFTETRRWRPRDAAGTRPVALQAQVSPQGRDVVSGALVRGLLACPGRLCTRLFDKFAHTGFQQVLPRHIGHEQ